MKDIITDLELLARPAKPLEFITPTGVDTEQGNQIINQLKEVLTATDSIVALSAPQIGLDARIICIKFNDTIKTFINPIVTKKKGSMIGPEIFSSMPGKEILISRPEEITVVYYTDEFKYEDNKLLGPAARILDQQIQLLDGILPDVLGLVSDIEQDGSFADLSEDEFIQVQDIYKQFIAAKTKSMQNLIEADPEAQKQFKLLKAAEEVINGRVTIVEPEEETAQRNSLAKAATVAKNKEQRARQKALQKAFVCNKQKRKG